MDSRRIPRFIIDPKVRQVGFVPVDSEPVNPTAENPLLAKASPLPVPSPPPIRKQQSEEVPLPGSYNPNDSVLGTSPMSSPNSKQDVSGRYDYVPSESLSMSMDGLNIQEVHVHTVMEDDAGTRKEATASVSPRILPIEQQASIQQAPEHRGAEVCAKQSKERASKAESHAKQTAAGEPHGAAALSGGAKGSKSFKAQNSKEIAVAKTSRTAMEKKAPDRIPEKEKKKDIPALRMQFDDEHRVAKARKHALIGQTEMKNRVELFRHLPQFVHRSQLSSLESKFFHDDAAHPHPLVYQVGLRYLTGDIVGANARCIAMLCAFRDLILNYSTPKEKTFVRDLTAKINSNVSFLTTCRPLSISMGNAIRFLKTRIAKLITSMSELDSKLKLVAEIDRFIQEKIIYADKEITKHAVTKIRDGDVVLTYASSCVIEMILVHAFELGRNFRVIIVDSRPKFEGKGLLKRLLDRGISCTYTHINAVSYIMQEVTRVFLGASSILSNGTVYSRVGTACVAMVAHAFHVPVLVCCETYKFHERVQLDSICSNELGDPDALVRVPGRNDLRELDGWDQSKHLQLLNLMYDATPCDFVSVVVTEVGMVPPTSVPVILREYRKEPIL